MAVPDTVRVTGGQLPSGPFPPQTFVGHWYVHGALLDIHRTTAAVTWSCGPSCTGTETLTLSRSPDGRWLNATVARINYTDASTGSPIRNPDRDPGDSSEIGDTSYFEYVAPHLLRETSVHASA